MELRIIVSTIIRKDNNLLLVREAKKECFGQWNIPSGHLEPGENIIEAAIRETKEETGYDIEITGISRIFNYKSRSGNHIIRYVFTGNLVSGKISFDKEEILEVKWIPIETITRMPDTDLRDAHVLRKIIENIDRKPSALDLIDDNFWKKRD